MPASDLARALAGVALSALVLGGSLPAGAQVAQPGTRQPAAQPAPTAAPVATPRPLPSAGSPAAGGTGSVNRNQTPSVLPGAAGTPPPGGSGAPGAAGGTSPSGGSAVINATQIPTLVPADQRAAAALPGLRHPGPGRGRPHHRRRRARRW